MIQNKYRDMIARRLREARKGVGMTQQKAAEALGIRFQQIQKYESGKNRISADSLAVLARAYKKDITFFFTEAK